MLPGFDNEQVHVSVCVCGGGGGGVVGGDGDGVCSISSAVHFVWMTCRLCSAEPTFEAAAYIDQLRAEIKLPSQVCVDFASDSETDQSGELACLVFTTGN